MTYTRIAAFGLGLVVVACVVPRTAEAQTIAQRVSSALSSESAARDALALARGDQQSVVEHRKVWQAARDRKDEQQAEEAATEQWNARLKGSGPA